MPKAHYGGKVNKSPEFKQEIKKVYDSLRKQPVGAPSDSDFDDRNFASNKGQINVVPETMSKLRNSNFRSKAKSTQLPAELKNDFQSNFKDLNFDIVISSFSILVPQTETIPIPVSKQPKRQKSGYYIKKKPMVPESQRRTLDKQNFDT